MIVALQTLVFFRESLLTALDGLIRPYYRQLTLAFTRSGNVLEDEESDDQVFAEYDDEKGVVFYPPMYAQRYAAVSDWLMDDRWCGKLEKVVDFGHHDMSFVKYLKEVPGIRCILGVDIETIPLRCSSDLLGGDEYSPKRESPLQVTLFQGNAADPDYRLIGCDAVVAIEMIEHMLPHDLERLVHTVFGFIKPWIVIFTTPNADFNVLFKALEKNGLRRMDHLFEWTREQFNDWCSNIVVRYPNYTVTCQGIGPGPPGTLHLGCCSQLCLFISKNYQKQADLNINSLALVENAPSPNNFSDLFGCWESSTGTRQEIERATGAKPESAESLTEIIYPEKQSHLTLVISSTLCNSMPYSDPTFAMEPFTYKDQTLQCNLDSEIGKSFLMFDYEDYYHVLVPRRRVQHKVYEIEDVSSRLNCTTLQVKKFSKTTQNLMAKNKIDSLVHTREVVNEIRHLTKTLNFNKFSRPEDGSHIWNNINWGDNAPYWNQYYKIVREYIYPFEAKSDEARILDLISEEINRLIDMQYDEEFSVDVNRLEIPLTDLMTVVQHITTDIDRVRDLLEWNGYEVVNDVVIHSRLVVDNTSVATHDEDWQDNDTLSDWDTDIHSTSMSVGSTIIPDLPGRCLRRALDQKVRSLRTMLIADEDITTELDRVVCRLMRLALQSSRGRQTPPPSRWMQCKLLDLLTLTEKAIERRKKQFIENYPILAIEEVKQPDVELDQDSRIKEIVEKYRHLIQPIEKTTNTDYTDGQNSDVDIMEDEFLSTTSNEFLKDYEYAKDISPSLVIPQAVFSTENFECAVSPPEDENPLERTKAWLDDDIEDTSFLKHELNYENISSGDTDHSLTNTRHKLKKASKRQKINKKDSKEFKADSKLSSPSKVSSKFKIKRDDKHKKKNGNTKTMKKVPKKKPSYNTLIKNQYSSSEYDSCPIISKRKNNENQSFNVSASKPIPESLIELCHPELKVDKGGQPRTTTNNITDVSPNIVIANMPSFNISATEESYLVDIVMQDYEETVALRRTIGTDAEEKPIETKDDIGSLKIDFDETLCPKHVVSTENVQSQTIFLNDINEPSTSKGIRHNISTDVQCGPDTFTIYPMLSACTSLVKIPPVFTAGVKIKEVSADTKTKGTDFGTSTQDTNTTTITPRLRSVGIKIKDSDVNLKAKTESGTMTVQDSFLQTSGTFSYSPKRSSGRNSIISSPETKMLKAISSNAKMDSGSEFCEPSIASSSKTRTFFVNASINASRVMIKSPVSKDVIIEASSSKNLRPRLCCGGVHVHSFRDKESSEDVVYQGQWQRHKPKAGTRKKSCNFTPLRKANEAAAKENREILKEKRVSSTEKVIRRKKDKKQIDAEINKPIQVTNKQLNKFKKDEHSQTKKPSVTSTLSSTAKKSVTSTLSAKKIPKPVKTVTKVASKLGMSVISKNTKSTFTVKKPTILSIAAIKKDIDKTQKLKKSYLPLYLRLRRASLLSDSDKENLNQNMDSGCEAASDKKIRERMVKKVPNKSLTTNDMKKDLLKFSDEVRENVSYFVFRNELENNVELPEDLSSESTVDHSKSTPRPLETAKRSLSPRSMNSSTCSSPNSIATVRAAATRSKNMSHRRHSASSYKSNLTTNSDSDSAPTMKKVIKRCKVTKKAEAKDVINKENVPESTQNTNKLAFNSRNKSVYIAQIKTEGSPPPNTLSRHKTQIANKSNIKIAARKESDEKRRSNDPTVSKKKSVKSDTSSAYEDFITSQSDSFESSDSANMVLVLEPQVNYDNIMDMQNISHVRNERTAECDVDPTSYPIPEWVQNSSLHSHASDIRDSVRQILEEILDLLISPDDDNAHHLDSKTVILSREQNHEARGDRDDPSDVKLVAEPVEITQLESDIETALKRTVDTVLGVDSATVSLSLNDTKLTVADLDMLSFDSIITVSKYSEYFSADNELNISLETELSPTILAETTTSVRDIFERKEPHMIQNTPGALAVQAFSGFSLDVEPVAGDQPDPVALIDSETGSTALQCARQATSEELFISGRSSDSYGSCLIDDDTVVPNWLFQLISQQQSVEDDRQPALLGPAVAPPNEPMYDANGNIIEPSMIGVGAGAGDGRGMHSDHSQDSSGRGTSLSSSNTSSGPQSEVSTILIEPAFTTPFDLLRDPMSSSTVLSTEAHSSDRTYRIDSDLRDDRTVILNGASDVDADVSSIDTDVPDLSDN